MNYIDKYYVVHVIPENLETIKDKDLKQRMEYGTIYGTEEFATT